MSKASPVTFHRRVTKGEQQQATPRKDCWEVASGFNRHGFNVLKKATRQLLVEDYERRGRGPGRRDGFTK